MLDAPLPILTRQAGQTIDQLYRHFAAPVPPVIEGCPCCIDKRRVDVLLTTPLRPLSGKALWSYVSGVFFTVGSQRDYKYLLPRIFEISILDLGDANNAEIVLGKLRLADWRSWPVDEQIAVEAAVDAWIDLAIARDRSEAADGFVGWETESVLCGAARAGFPLARWQARLKDPAAAAVLSDLKSRFPDELSGFWEDVPDGRAQLRALLLA